MSTTAPISERTITAVLLALWTRPDSSIQHLLRQTLAPLPDIQHALEILRQRKCLIEQTPTSLSLISTGLPCWRDILEHLAKTEHLRLARRTMVFAKTTSTNDLAWQAAGGSPADTDGLLVLADEQSAGRGRLGHHWQAKPEQSILMSLLLRNLPSNSSATDDLTLLAGLAVARALEAVLGGGGGGDTRLSIKWPNDILHHNKKLAGILVERRDDAVVLGIGVNVLQSASDFPPDLADRATSLYQVKGAALDRLRVVAAVIRELDRTLAFSGDDCRWLPEWKSRCPMLNTRVQLRSNGQLLAGLVLDIDPARGLLLRDDTGATHFLSAQTTTLAI